MRIHPDYYDFVKALNERKVDFVIVGAYSLAFHGFPRATVTSTFGLSQTKIMQNLDELRGFRHVFRHAYSYGLDVKVQDIDDPKQFSFQL